MNDADPSPLEKIGRYRNLLNEETDPLGQRLFSRLIYEEESKSGSTPRAIQSEV